MVDLANGLERLNREARWRSRAAVLFPNIVSCKRPVTAVLMKIGEEWETGRTYLPLEAIRTTGEVVKARDKAVAAGGSGYVGNSGVGGELPTYSSA